MNSVQNHDTISSDRVEGTKVYNRVGEKLGSIDNLVIDKRTGQVTYAILEFGGFLGMGSDRFPLPWGMLSYDSNQDGYVVPLDKAQLQNAPRYTEDAAPEFTPDYRRQVQDYYGLDRHRNL